MQRIYKIVLKANIVGIKNAKAYMFGSELDYKVRESVKYALTGYDYPHGTGHGVGCLVHENPRVNKIYDKPLLENSIVTIEPGIYLNNKFGVRIEDTIVIIKNGCKVLTDKASKDLVI
jgi:Xaa-Pro aminopeptidase